MTERIKTIGYGDNDPRCRDYRVQNPPIPYDPKQEVRNRFQQFVEENRRLREMGGVIKNPENGRTIFSNQVLHSQPEEELIVCGGGERSEFHAVRGLEASGPVLSKVSGVGGRVGGVVERDGSECIQILNSGDEKTPNSVVIKGEKERKSKQAIPIITSALYVLSTAAACAPPPAHHEVIDSSIPDINDIFIQVFPAPIDPTASEELTKTVEIIKQQILDVPTDKQKYSLSCESSAAGMILKYYKGDPPEGYSCWEHFMLENIPLNCNPHYGYAGLPSGRMSTECNALGGFGYGVYAEPIKNILDKTGVESEVIYNKGYEGLKKEIDEGNPVMVWLVGIAGVNSQPEYKIDPRTGERYVYHFGQHTWVVRGYRETEEGIEFLINDPFQHPSDSYWVKEIPKWEVFYQMALVIKKPQEKISEELK